jgi:membrane-associated phospholipid phosphatase
MVCYRAQHMKSVNQKEPLETQSVPEETPAITAHPVEAVKVAAAKQIAPKPTRTWRARVFQAYLVIATIGFGLLVVLASMFSYFPVDLSISRAVQTIHVAWFASLMWWVSLIGYAPQIYVLVAVVTILLFVTGLRWEAVTVLASTASGTGLVELIKLVVHRPRPGADLVNVLQQLNNSSFPSGHVLAYTAFFGFLFFLSYTLLKPSFARAALLVILGSLVALIGLSRIYVGDHWASDVIGAYLLGSLWLVLSISIYRWGKTRFFVRQPLAPEKQAATVS